MLLLLEQLNDHQFGQELFIRLAVCVFCECLSICVYGLLSLLGLRVGYGI